MAKGKELRSYIKEVPLGDEVEIYFVKISWPLPYDLVSEDVLLYRVPLEDWEREKREYYGRILNNKKYFRVCGHCFELNHVGHMDGKYLCQSCAEEYFGVVH